MPHTSILPDAPATRHTATALLLAVGLAACGASDATGPRPDPPPPGPVASVTIDAAADTLEAWDALPLTATTRDARGTPLGRAVRWRVSDTTIATIDSVTGVLAGRARGTVRVTATSEGRSATAHKEVVIKYWSLSAGAAHACNIASGGIAWCWGLNGREGRIGLPDVRADAHSTEPVMVPGGHRFVELSAFGRTTCGIRIDSRVLCWGDNSRGIAGLPETTGHTTTPALVSTYLRFKSISVGAEHACSLGNDNRIFCWGDNRWGNFGAGNTASSHIPTVNIASFQYASVTAGNSYACATSVMGEGWCWGADGAGQHGTGLPISHGDTWSHTPRPVTGTALWLQLSASNGVTCGVTLTHIGHCWGTTAGSRLGSAGAETSTPRAISGNHSWRHIATGARHACGLTMAFDVYCWGENANGELGADLTDGSVTPVRAGSVRASEVSVANIATGAAGFTCAISTDRLTTWCWGRNDWGQLGNGTQSTAVARHVAPTIVVGQRPR